MATPRKIDKALLDQLLEGRDARQVFNSDGLFNDLKKALAERILEAEMDHHLDQDEEQDAGNHRNGHSAKTVTTDRGRMRVSIPRDRQSRFEPRLIEKHCRRLPGFDDRIISMYSSGMTTREIRDQVSNWYGVEVSADLISRVTDGVHEELENWRRRPLERTYAVMYFDALRVKIRDEGVVSNKAAHLAIGVSCNGKKDVLGLWIEQTEGAKFWLRVMNDLKQRGVRDVLIAVVDGLKGFPEAIEAVFPEALVQTCIVHLIRHSLHFASYKELKSLSRALKPIYRADSAETAWRQLEEFDRGEWGRKYPMIAESWRRNWERIIPFFDFPSEVRRMIYTTNTIESLNSTIRRAVRIRGHFPNDRAAEKLIYLTLQKVVRRWKRPPHAWYEARAQFAIKFGSRFIMDDQ